MSSEAWLIRKAKKGDTKAYGELIQLHKDYFYRNAFCYVKNVDLAGDVFQEAVTIGMLSIKDLKNPNYFRTWMTRIIYNCANEMFRKAEKEIGSLDAEIRDRAEENGGASREEINSPGKEKKRGGGKAVKRSSICTMQLNLWKSRIELS